MEKYMGDSFLIGGYCIDGIQMLDDSTCCLYFEEFNECGKVVQIVVEKWLDDDSWHFTDNYFAENGYSICSAETTHFSDKEKEQCRMFIDEWLELLGK